MKFLRFACPLLLIVLSTLVFAQSEAPKPAKATPSEAQKSFSSLKTLAGTWTGSVTTDPPMKDMGDGSAPEVLMRVTSRGNAIVHEMYEPGKENDPARYDHPITMLYVDNDRLNLIHYCDAGNRPHMVARTSPDGKKIEFDFVELSGSNQNGHMYHAVFTLIDANHHIEDWTYMMPGDKPLRAHLDLQRKSNGGSAPGK